MHTTVQFLDAACAKLGGVSDYRIAKELGVSKQVVSNWRSGVRTVGNDHALGLAGILEIDPMYVIACAEKERAKDAARRAEWQRIAGRVKGAGGKIASLLRHAAAACVVLGAGIFGSSVPTPARAAELQGPSVYIMTNRRRRPGLVPQRLAGAIASPA